MVRLYFRNSDEKVTVVDLDSITYQNTLNREVRTVAFLKEEIEYLRAQRILITGAGGSIGSRIALAMDQIGGVNFLSTDRDESALHSLSLKLTSTALFEGQNFLLMDIRDQEGCEQIFRAFKPTVVIHAAALKHLSVLEKQPREALLTNVYGTLNMLEASKDAGVGIFINVSTDKAANPVSVLGKSKFLAELLTTHHKNEMNLSYRSVRFGNVFGSRGSVIETFTSQILNQMPVTLTESNVERFFMHPDEAAFLTIKSIFINDGDISLFDMGEPVLIRTVIERLQNLLGGKSKIVYTGLRPGEKISEDLFGGVENRSVVIPNLIESGNHRLSLKNNEDLVSQVLLRNNKTAMTYLKKI